ncbi:MAG: pyridoxal-phosphate-dependent aminotransferase family protein [Fidelibacterota bacterium]
MDKPKLFIPGPTHVDADLLDSLAEYPIGHRTPQFSELYNEVVRGIQKVLFTTNRIYLGTCTATGLMEAAVRNSVQKKCANFVCGAFSKRWYEITKACGFECDEITVELGKAIKPELVRETIQTGEYDAITIVHNETSTGVMNPIEEIAEVIHDFPEVALLVDMVSSMGSVKVEIDKLDIDIALASVQKGWGLPPGFAICSVSENILERSSQIPQKGYYFDFTVMEKYAQRSQTPSTPSIPHMYGLKAQLARIFAEGLENRFNRHRTMAETVRKWVRQNFELFPEAGYESDTVTCAGNPGNTDLIEMSSRLLKYGFLISGGYGPLKGKTFRIAHMGNLQLNDIEELLEMMDKVLKEM